VSTVTMEVLLFRIHGDTVEVDGLEDLLAHDFEA
jgi:hypothetical protein